MKITLNEITVAFYGDCLANSIPTMDWEYRQERGVLYISQDDVDFLAFTPYENDPLQKEATQRVIVQVPLLHIALMPSEYGLMGNNFAVADYKHLLQCSVVRAAIGVALDEMGRIIP